MFSVVPEVKYKKKTKYWMFLNITIQQEAPKIAFHFNAEYFQYNLSVPLFLKSITNVLWSE